MSFINTVNDGGVVAGSRQITVIVGGPTGTSTVFETDDFNFDYEVSEVVRRDGQDIPNGRRLSLGIIGGSFTLQLNTTNGALPAANSAIVIPSPLDQFTTVDGGNATVYCTITKIGRKETKAGLVQVPCSFVVNLSGAANTGHVTPASQAGGALAAAPTFTGVF